MSSPPIRLLEHPPARGAWNMAVDEALMEAARAGRVTLRLYRWKPACLSLGRNERARGRYDTAEAARRGIDVVRRPTGGRAVYHDDELTYAVTAPARRWGGLRESYARINRALARGLRALGVSAETTGSAAASAAGRPSASAPSSPSGPPARAQVACFAAAAPGEVTAAGRKLIGSAQWRHRGALLQHGSILLSDGQGTVAELRRSRAARPVASYPAPPGASAVDALAASSAAYAGGAPWHSAKASTAVGLEELLGRRPGLDEIRAALVAGFREEMEGAVAPGELSPAERLRAARLEAHYRDHAWTWRR